MISSNFRDHLRPDDDPRLAELRGLTVREYAEYAKTDPFAGPMIAGWAKLYPEPFVGVTTDGVVLDGLYRLDDVRPGEEAPTKEMVVAAEALLDTLDDAGRGRVSYPVDAHEWRSWANPEFLQHDTGIRLDEVGPATRDAALNLLAATLSPQGYQLARTAMTINGYLGEIVDLHHLMNEFSYNLAVYGEPSTTQPWGWQLFGHHLALNALVIGPTMVLTPVFFGAEPNTTDGGDPAGPFGRRIELARAVMAALPTGLRDRAVTYGRWSTRPCPRAGCTPVTSGPWPAASRTTGSSPTRASRCPTCRWQQGVWCGKLCGTRWVTCPPAPWRPGCGSSTSTPATRGSPGSAAGGTANRSTSASRARWCCWSWITTAGCSWRTPSRRRSTSTPRCAPPMRGTMARH